jgi:uncharacterized membrane protein (UPF0182 family)
MAWRGIIAVAMIIIAACLIALGLTADCLVDWLWFSDVRYPAVFWTILGAKVALFLAVFAASVTLLWLNGSLAYRLAERQRNLPAVVSTSRSRSVLRRLPGSSPTAPPCWASSSR